MTNSRQKGKRGKRSGPMAFRILCPAAPQARPRFNPKTRRAIHDDSDRLVRFKSQLAVAFSQWHGYFGDEPVALAIDCQWRRPDSHTRKDGSATEKWMGWPPACYGDADNLAKPVMDEMVKAGVVADDSQVVDLKVSRSYGDEDATAVVAYPVAAVGGKPIMPEENKGAG